ncbi:MAG: glycosyltransferase family 4 protein [Thermoleophilia bacterium]
MTVVWRGPLTDPSGWAAEGRALVRGLRERGADLVADHRVWHYREAVTPAGRETLADLMLPEPARVDASIEHAPGRLLDPYAHGALRIGRTALSALDVPRDWVVRLNQLDETWVPSCLEAEALAAAGVDPERVAVIPEAVELDVFDPATPPIALPDAHGTVFLAVAPWGAGTEGLLAAWCAAFRGHDDVTLVLKTWSDDGLDLAAIEGRAAAAVAAAGHDPAAMADVVILDDLLPDARMPSLYAAADAVVTATPAGRRSRVALEAAAMGLPALAPAPAALRAAHDDPAARRSAGRVAREAAAGRDHRAVAGAILDRIRALAPRPRAVRPVAGDRPAVLLRGSVFGVHSLAGVNRDLARALLRRDEVTLGLVDVDGARLDASDPAYAALEPSLSGLLPRADVTLRHAYPPALGPVHEGRVAQFLHWEYGAPPLGWVRAQREHLDEVWVASRHVRDGMLAGGMDPERVALVPLGIDPERFRPGAEPLDLGDRAPGVRLLFVGGLIWRKGIDLLLAAYTRAFTARDDVTLVIKSFGARGPYVPQDADAQVRALQADPRAPRILHLTDPLPDGDMPRLYAACDALVQPFRGEGYGLPIAEAMACGLPAIVPDRGAARDFCGPGTAILVPSRPVPVESATIGGMLVAGRPEVVEVEVADLVAAMRAVVEDPACARAIGAAAAAHVRAEHTWDRTAVVAGERLRALAA